MLSVLRAVLLKCKDENWDSNCMECSIKDTRRQSLLKAIESLAPSSVIQIDLVHQKSAECYSDYRYHLKEEEKKKNKNRETKIWRQSNSALNPGLAPECHGKPTVFGGETLLLETPHTMAMGYGEIRLALIPSSLLVDIYTTGRMLCSLLGKRSYH